MVRGKKVPLSAEDEVAAVRYAPLAVVLMTYQLANLVTLYTALGLMQVANLTSWDETSPITAFAAVFLIALVVVLAVVVPLQISYIRNARAFARSATVSRSTLATSEPASGELN
ncbi:hypothetical protein RWH43_17465 [Microbacterium sp. KSW2-21]|uniref:Uncharacterized protein n=1 Tax=Microbacterium algihabitans TaxID=3075992 RepID=A0ABU3S0A0_9MICO|nr:hypothetical protein [Microbacterium sp. KSW2-21]MDU0328552.1 hypothetical protein [Microbacterium sp. KSW2-21]